MRFWLLFLLLAFESNRVFAGPLQISYLHVNLSPSWLYSVDVRVGTQSPDKPIIGDVLYLPGFADRFDNHAPLFKAWNDAGFRVISFDYPSHGETTGTSLNFFTFKKLAALAYAVERAVRQYKDRPLLLAGWSTGGLLALRMIQSPEFPVTDRWPQGLILFAPGVAVRTQVGQPSLLYPLGQVTTETLTHDPNPPHVGSPRPRSPGSVPFFAMDLKINSLLSQRQNLPPHIPALVFAGGDQADRYVVTSELKAWMNRLEHSTDAQIFNVEVPGARHELDNETMEFGGPIVRLIAAQFAENLVHGKPEETQFSLSPCRQLLQSGYSPAPERPQ